MQFVGSQTFGDSVSGSPNNLPGQAIEVSPVSDVPVTQRDNCVMDTNESGEESRDVVNKLDGKDDEDFGAVLSKREFKLPVLPAGRRATYQVARNSKE